MTRFFVALSAALLLAGCSAMPFLSGEIRVTADELTQKIARRFPLEKSVAGLLDVTLVRPRVELNADQQRIATSFEVSLKLALSGKSVAGTLKVSGRPEYVAVSRSLFLRDARVEQIRIDNMPDALSAGLAKTASNFAKDAVEDKPLYTFKAEDLTRYGVRYEPERIEVRTDALVLKVK
ncbi:MAG: DUF1439 domain-containing protein [Burkholderiales bacterium]|nr:DUF1439 domain-containing protein [Burkholderiales bacterium]